MSRQLYSYWILCASLLATTPSWAQGPRPPKEEGNSKTGAAPETQKARDAGLVELGIGLESARSFYQVGAYDQCIAAYPKLLTPANIKLLGESQPKTLEQARVYFAACLLALGDSKRADDQLRSAMKANPLMASPDPVLFPSQVRDLFFRVKGTFLEEIRRAQELSILAAQRVAEKRERQAQAERERIARLEKLATLETVVAKNKRWVAAIPFGVGQFQNGSNGLGALFLVTEGALLVTAVAATSIELGLHSSIDGGRRTGDYETLRRNLKSARVVGTLASASGLLIAAVGIVEAEVNFVQEIPFGQRPRAQQRSGDELSIRPSVSADQNQAFVGLSGTF